MELLDVIGAKITTISSYPKTGISYIILKKGNNKYKIVPSFNDIEEFKKTNTIRATIKIEKLEE